MARLTIHLAENNELGFDAKTAVTMSKLCGQLGLEIIDTETDLLKFLEDDITPMEKRSCLVTANYGNYANEWLSTFKPLLVQINTLVRELQGSWMPISCSIVDLQYPKRGLTLMSTHIGLVTFQLLVFMVAMVTIYIFRRWQRCSRRWC